MSASTYLLLRPHEERVGWRWASDLATLRAEVAHLLAEGPRYVGGPRRPMFHETIEVRTSFGELLERWSPNDLVRA